MRSSFSQGNHGFSKCFFGNHPGSHCHQGTCLKLYFVKAATYLAGTPGMDPALRKCHWGMTGGLAGNAEKEVFGSGWYTMRIKWIQP